MTSFKYTAATLALLLTSGLGFAATTTTTTQQPAATQNGPECPAAGTVAEADLPAECKNQAAMPKQDDVTTGAAATVQPDANAAATPEMPKQDDTAAGQSQDTTATGTTATTVVPKSYNSTASETTPDTGTAEIPKTDDTTAGKATTAQPEAKTTTTTTELPKQDNAAATATAPATEAATAEASASSSVLASQFMGQTVYSAANESVGEINDIVMNRELDNIVAIIGVGGFLGIGEKDVAVPIEEITAVKDENNNLKLTIAATKEQLEAAPTFDRTALK